MLKLNSFQFPKYLIPAGTLISFCFVIIDLFYFKLISYGPL